MLGTVRTRLRNSGLLFLGGLLCSDLMWIIQFKHDREKLERDGETRSRVLDRLLARARAGEQLDLRRELVWGDDRGADEIFAELLARDESWRRGPGA